MSSHVYVTVIVATLTLTAAVRSEEKVAWKDARAVLEAADEWEFFALEPDPKLKPDPKDALRGWKIRGKTTVKVADTRTALLTALDKGIADEGERARKRREEGYLESGGCFQPRHGLGATVGRQTVEVLICFECKPVRFFLGDRDGEVATNESPQDAFDKVLNDAGVSVAPRLLKAKDK